MNPALRLCEPEGLAAVGLENLLGKPVRIALVETVKSLSALDMAHQRASEWFTALGSLIRFGPYQ